MLTAQSESLDERVVMSILVKYFVIAGNLVVCSLRRASLDRMDDESAISQANSPEIDGWRPNEGLR